MKPPIDEPIARFVVPGKAVGKNAAYLRLRNDLKTARRARGLLLSQAGRDFKDRVKRIGHANRPPWWPKDPLQPKRVRVTVRMFGSRHDAGACTQLVKDALEGVYYDNDRIVEHGAESPADPKGTPARVEIDVELCEVFSDDETRARREAADKRQLARIRRATKTALR